ncbi:MAG TPA: class I SAM-dependent methyltransferase [Pedococcus sp.]|jgi:hypothetical protein
MDLRSSARRMVRANSRRVARVAVEYEQHKADARARLARPSLVDLAKKHGTDKWGAHRYAQHYHRHFEHLRDEPVRLLEIGVGGYSHPAKGGQSLRMWKEFFPRGQVFGLDLHDKSRLQEERIRIFRGDQGDPAALTAVADEIGHLDIIIDDGSHFSEHVVTTFETLFPRLADNGLYAVEDLQTSYWPEWHGSEDRDSPDTSMGLLKRLVDGLNYEEFLDEDYEPTYADRHVVAAHFFHNLAILQKGVNAEGTYKRSFLKERYASS